MPATTHTPSEPPAPKHAHAQVTIARQAILNSVSDVFAYELFDRSTATNGHTAATDAQLLFNVLSGTDGESLAGNTLFFINCTLDSIAGGHLDLVSPDRVVLEIPPMPIAESDQIQDRLFSLMELKKRGFRLAFEYSVLTRPYESWLPLASFIKFDLAQVKPDVIGPFVKLAQSTSKALLIAEKVETLAQYQQVAGLGINLFQGYWFAKPVVIRGQNVRPAQATILQLINLVRQQASTAEIEDLIKRDPTLSFNLLRFINSAGFGLRTEVTSFKHAVMLLGLKRLFKWAALLMTTSRSGDMPPAVGTTAVVRGRLMELLAADILPPDECDNAFVVGIFSLLDTMLGMDMSDALATLSLPPSVTDALLHNNGPLSLFLTLTVACETGDDAAFAQSANLLNLNSSQVNMAHLQALSWADSLGR